MLQQSFQENKGYEEVMHRLATLFGIWKYYSRAITCLGCGHKESECINRLACKDCGDERKITNCSNQNKQNA